VIPGNLAKVLKLTRKKSIMLEKGIDKRGKNNYQKRKKKIVKK